MSTPDLLYSEAEDDLRAAVRSLLADRCPPSAVLAEAEGRRPYDPSLWRSLAAEMGTAGLLVPDKLGGQGATAREAAVVLEELGRAVAPVPYLTSAVLATTALLGCDTDEQHVARLLGALASGRAVGALALPLSTPPGGGAPPATVTARGDGALTGRVTAVAGAAGAEVLLVPAEGPDGYGLYAVETTALGAAEAPGTAETPAAPGAAETPTVPSAAETPATPATPAVPAVPAVPAAPGVTVEPLTPLDLTRPLAALHLTEAPARRLAGPDRARASVGRALTAGAGLLASEQLGLAEWCLTETVRHTKERHQFGRPIGSFQALKHRMAGLWLELVSARATARHAADALAADSPEAPVAVAVAQAYCARAAVHAAQECVQLHGGIGMTWEHPAHLYLKRAKSDEIALGTPGRHREALAGLVDLPAPVG
ncbi:acyl-CoA dehydrogenase family protein [Streptomyces sparsogenes]|uniref:Acyl-CoA dehydrogenase n=1 Tax=Streptomyces sparsogenes DSM 40356 TaxID=1331668 RepID=A0A1R1S9U3_9ACTN|nr:acyl-CoA dehydrogenase family protein [Streptomyces sparsogenes]OMI34990.1 acyl-CoA dehydrogenase [Streptomyces sparsogenes DSM 40356]